MNDSLIINATNALQNLSSLKVVDINLFKYREITNKCVENLTFRLSRLKSLQTYQLHLPHCSQISTLDFKSRGQTYVRFPKLQNLVFNLPLAVWGAKEKHKSLCPGLEELRALKTFTLDATGCLGAVPNNILTTLTKQLTALNGLEKLSLSLDENYYLYRDMPHLAKCLGTLKNLKNLNVSFSNVGTQLKLFNCNLHHLSSLESLRLYLKYCGTGNKNYQSLGESLQHIRTLRNLDLTLIESGFPDEAFTALSQGIKCNSHLQKIRLHFLECNTTYIENEGLRNLAEALRAIQSLKSFYLCFGSQCAIDEGMKSLSKSLAKHNELSNLELLMQSTYKWTDKGFEAFLRDLRKMKSLRRFSLKFINCREITDQGFVELRRALLKLKNLVKLDMRFDNCPKVSENKVRQVHQKLNRHDSLENWEIIFSGPPDFHDVVLTKIKNHFEYF